MNPIEQLFNFFFSIPQTVVTAIVTILLFIFGLGGTGCAELEKNQMAQSAKAVAEKVGDAVAAGVENGIRDIQATASVQGINPGYKFRMKVTVGTVVDVDGDIGMTGVAGQMSINAASGRDLVPAAGDTPLPE